MNIGKTNLYLRLRKKFLRFTISFFFKTSNVGFKTGCSSNEIAII